MKIWGKKEKTKDDTTQCEWPKMSNKKKNIFYIVNTFKIKAHSDRAL